MALGGVIECGLYGIQRGLELPAPALRDPALVPEDQAKAARITPLPSDLSAALDLLEADSVLCESLGDLLLQSVMGVRRAQYARAVAEGAEWVRASTFSTF